MGRIRGHLLDRQAEEPRDRERQRQRRQVPPLSMEITV
jgi:hypothetical protein